MSELPVTLFDLIVGGIVLLSTLLALSRGGVREAFGLLSWAGAIAVAIYAFAPVRPMVADAVGNELVADAATLAIVFFVPFIALRIVTGLVARAVGASTLGPVDKLVGVAFGFARGALIVCGAYLVGSVIVAEDQHPEWVKRAVLQPTVERGADWLAQFLPPGILEGSKKAAAQAAADAAGRAREIREARGTGSGEPGYGAAVRERMDALVGGRVE